MPDPTTPLYTWEDRAGRYRGAGGRFVSAGQVQRAVTTAVQPLQAEARALSAALRAGTLDLAAWESGMRVIIKTAHLMTQAAAVGGWEQMTASEYGRAGQAIREQYTYLSNFSAEVAAGKVTGRALDARAELYALHGRVHFATATAAEFAVRGATEERNVYGPTEHCPGCQDATGAGWVPRGSLVPPGNRQCRARCSCHLEYR